MDIATGEPVFFGDIGFIRIPLFVVDPDSVSLMNEIKHGTGTADETMHIVLFILFGYVYDRDGPGGAVYFIFSVLRYLDTVDRAVDVFIGFTLFDIHDP